MWTLIRSLYKLILDFVKREIQSQTDYESFQFSLINQGARANARFMILFLFFIANRIRLILQLTVRNFFTASKDWTIFFPTIVLNKERKKMFKIIFPLRNSSIPAT